MRVKSGFKREPSHEYPQTGRAPARGKKWADGLPILEAFENRAQEFLMMPTRSSLSAMACAVALLSGCGGGSDAVDAPTPAPPPPAAASVAISGKLTAPDGATPIANALVYVEGSMVAVAGDSVKAAEACGTPPTASWASACTSATGAFAITAAVPAGAKLVAVKGAFRQETVLTLPASGPLDLGTVSLKPASGAKLAVVTGSFDRIQDVLAKLGYGQLENGQLKLGTEAFALFDGNSSLPANYKQFSALLADADGDGKADIHNYSVVFLNCGLDDDALQTPANVAVLRNYVLGGGRVYASDWASDFVEQTFPDYIDFHGSDNVAAGVAEGLGAARLGEGEIELSATLDPALKSWLQGVACEAGSCLDANGGAHIEGFLGGWVLMNGIHAARQPNVKVWAQATVDAVSRPMTVTFPAGQGRVTYTSYHTEPDNGVAGFLPQERVLQFLVFEL